MKSRLPALAGIIAATVLILFIRRPDQFLHPYLWVEDGRNILPDYIAHGWSSLLSPVNGYFITSSKLISLAAFKLSFLHTPQIQAALTILFTCGVMAAIALAPTHLPRPFLCALAVLLVPTDAEVFAVSLYSFWWAGLLLFVALLWRADGGWQWARAVMILIGGTSSPIIVPIAALLSLRAIVDRRLSGFVMALIAIICAAADLYHIHGQGMDAMPWRFPDIVGAADHYVGFFFVGSYVISAGPLTGIGLLIAALAAAAAWMVRGKLDRYFGLLVLTFALICFLTSVRNPDLYPHPFIAAPRHYFYPYVLLTWIGIWIASVSRLPVRAAFATAYAFAIVSGCFGIGVGRTMARYHDAIDWRANVLACAASDTYPLPIHYIGSAKDIWTTDLKGEDCRRLIAESLF